MTTTPPAPTLTAATDADPCPRVEVLVTPMPGDATTVWIWREYSGRRDLVRGAAGVTTSGDFLVIDYEAPFGIDVVYSCQTADVGGVPSALSPDSSAVNLAVTDVWAQDPLDPAYSMPWPSSLPGTARLLRSLRSMTFGIEQEAIATIGSALPIGQSDVRQAASEIPVQVVTRTDADTQTFLALIRQAGAVLCLRVPTTVKLLDPVSFIQVGALEASVTNDGQAVVWSAVALSIRGPGIDVVVPTRTLNDVDAEVATLDDLTLLYATLIDLQRGP